MLLPVFILCATDEWQTCNYRPTCSCSHECVVPGCPRRPMWKLSIYM